MLDYYGSIIQDNNQIDRDLVQHFRKYNENHILRIINDLRKDGTLPLENSVSGWRIFGRKFIIDEINNILEKGTLLAKQRLEFMKLCDSIHFNPDISQRICEEINPKTIIPNN
tara:strand:- start:36 stop:374 length:339 start_codon:yes stop_codon:yes gene_type:complete